MSCSFKSASSSIHPRAPCVNEYFMRQRPYVKSTTRRGRCCFYWSSAPLSQSGCRVEEGLRNVTLLYPIRSFSSCSHDPTQTAYSENNSIAMSVFKSPVSHRANSMKTATLCRRKVEHKYLCTFNKSRIDLNGQ